MNLSSALESIVCLVCVTVLDEWLIRFIEVVLFQLIARTAGQIVF